MTVTDHYYKFWNNPFFACQPSVKWIFSPVLYWLADSRLSFCHSGTLQYQIIRTFVGFVRHENEGLVAVRNNVINMG